LTPEQARTLLEALKGHRHEVLYSLMLSTGLRRGEALGLKWQDYDTKLGVIAIRRQLKLEGGKLITSDTKTSRSRRSVNLPSQIVVQLESHRQQQGLTATAFPPEWTPTDYIFTSLVGGGLDPRNLNRDFHEVCERAGLGHWHPHKLRHSAASLILAQGVKLQVVSEVLGHASIRMIADVYGHILAPDREVAT
jgi:integrase